MKSSASPQAARARAHKWKSFLCDGFQSAEKHFQDRCADTASLDDIPIILTSLLHSSDGRRVTFQIASV
ncbi:hypothetical protein GGQ68_002171 [Sagittula marina]|uniref:Uncharacterized protein n=1 Tax=Sagittula marina TaxID=943940 RepID=A0A7W6GSQ9_9RHOB|nr:hypothetical protein [Sagittula marina]